MKRILNGELKVWHLIMLIALLAIGSGTASGSPQAAQGSITGGADEFFAGGTFNMTATSASSSAYVKAVNGDTEVLRATFTIPAGQRADIAAFFGSEAYKYPNGYCYVKFNLDAIGPADLKPGKQWMVDGYIYKGGYPAISAQGWIRAVPAGTHSIIVTMSSTGGDCYVSDRSLILISNRHP